MGDMGYKKRKDFTEEEWIKIVKEALRLWLEKGWKSRKIAKELNLSEKTISKWIDEVKIPKSLRTTHYSQIVADFYVKKIVEISEEEGIDPALPLAKVLLDLDIAASKRREKEEGT